MAGLDPAIHVFRQSGSGSAKTWMPVSSTGMTGLHPKIIAARHIRVGDAATALSWQQHCLGNRAVLPP
jgi:hypothetical protein